MIRAFRNRLRRFGKDENGAVIILEFVIFVPILLTSFLMAVELAVYSMRQMQLDRGLDMAVRFVRLNTNENYTHNDIKDMICNNSGWLENCDTTLRLEMIALNPRNFSTFNQSAQCVDTSLPVEPVRGFTLGQENELMMLRACVKFDPVFPTSGLGEAFDKDGAGRASMIATAAFVQEPL